MSSIHKDPRGKSPFWYACFTLPNGKRTSRSTKHTDKHKAQAVCAAWEKTSKLAREGNLQDLAARKVIGDVYQIANGEPLPSSQIEKFLKKWVADKQIETVHSTYRKYKDVIHQFLVFIGPRAQQDISRISVQDIRGFQKSEAGRVSISSTNHALKVLRSALREAFREGLIHTNPAERVGGIKRGKAETERRAFTMPELQKLLEIASDEWRGLILFGYYTGQRLSDLASLTWRNVDTVRKEISLVTSKTGRHQVIPIANHLLDFIECMPAGENPMQPLFPKAYKIATKTKRISTLSNQFYALMAATGLVQPRQHKSHGSGRNAKRKLNEISFHCLRHTTTSCLKNTGTTSAVSQEIVGHDSPAISKIYTHIEMETMRQAVNNLPTPKKTFPQITR
jgi:integrase